MFRSIIAFLMLAGPLLGFCQEMTARDYFILGQAKYRINACEIAAQEFTKAIQLDGKYVNAYLGRALCQLCMEEYDKALADINQAVKLAPDQPIYLANRGRIKLAKGDLSGADLDFREVVDKDSTLWEGWFGLGGIASLQKRFPEAESYYDKAVHFNPKSAVSLARRAEMRITNGKFQDARADLRKAVEMEPLYGDAWLLLGKSQHALSEYGSALDHFSKAARLMPEDPRPYFERGSTWLRINRTDSAVANFSRAIKLDSKLADAYYLRGLAYEKAGDVNAANKDFGHSIKLSPKGVDAYLHRAALARGKGKTKAACKDYTAALGVDPQNAGILLERAMAYLELEDNVNALIDFGQYTKRMPEDGKGWYGLGEANYRQGNLQEACFNWQNGAERGSEEARNSIRTFCNK